MSESAGETSTEWPERSSSCAGHATDSHVESVHSSSASTSELSQSAGRNEELALSPPISASRTGTQDVLASDDTRWQPFWLRQSIASCFFGLFLGLTVAFAVMLGYSRHYEGICSARGDLLYLWRFGPAAVLTLISILWSRVELQTLRYMHWKAIQTGESFGPQGYKLDYSQMFLPMILLRSLRLRHYFVFFIVATSIILKAQIVLSAGLFRLAAVESELQVDIQTLDSFNTVLDLSEVTSNAAWYQAKAVQDFEMVLPFGLSKNFAYQTFQERGTVDSPITAVVDGLFAGLTCLKLENWEVQDINTEEKFGLAIELHFEDCQSPITVEFTEERGSELFGSDFEGPTYMWKFDLDLEPLRPCSSLPQQHRQFLYVGTYLMVSNETSTALGNGHKMILDTCAAVLCSPTAWLSQVEVTDDGFSPQVVDLQHTISDVDANIWDMMKLFTHESEATGTYFSGEFDGSVGPLAIAYRFRGEVNYFTDRALFQSSILEQAVMNLTEVLGPAIGNNVIRQKQKGHITGNKTQQLDRLQVNEVVGLLMTALSGLSAINTLWAIFKLAWAPWVWSRDPATVLGFIVLLSSKGQLHETLSNAAPADQTSTKMQWSHGTYSPLILRSWLRVSFSIFIAGIIAVLSLGITTTYGYSDLVVVGGPESQLTLLWTSVPALVMLIVALYVNATDSAIRGLATLSMLSAQNCGVAELDISLLDMLGLRTLYHSLRLKTFTITISQAMATFAAFLTALSAVLFTLEQIPMTYSGSFEQQSWFGSKLVMPVTPDAAFEARTRMGSLMMNYRWANLTYPRNTYRELVFPALQLNESGWNDDVSIKVRIPAAKLIPECIKLPEEEYASAVDGSHPSITQLHSCPRYGMIDYWGGDDPLYSGDHEQLHYIAASFASPRNPLINDSVCTTGNHYSDIDHRGDQGYLYDMFVPWRSQTYAWGKASFDDMSFEYLSFWQCNYSWFEVVTETTLIVADTGNMIIDHSVPPVQLYDDMVPWEPPFAVPDVDGEMSLYDGSIVGSAFPERPHMPQVDLQEFGTMFHAILEPMGSIRLEYLGDEDREAEILKELHSNFALAAAQVVNIENRLDINEMSAMPAETHEDLARIEATVTNGAYWRLVQNPVPTFIIIGILSLILIVNLWAMLSEYLGRPMGIERRWLLDMDLKGLAPNGFGSIEMMSALLRGSNASASLSCDTDLQRGSLGCDLESKRFRMGWFQRGGELGEVYTIGEVHDEDFEFLGAKGAAKNRASIHLTNLQSRGPASLGPSGSQSLMSNIVG